MTPFELNKAIAELVYPDLSPDELRMTVRIDDSMSIYNDAVVDYCNNWNDLMPLVVEHSICFDIYGGELDHCYTVDTWSEETLHWTEGDNPQLALAECLLKVLEAKELLP